MDDGACIRVTVTGTGVEGGSVSLSTRGTLYELGEGWIIRYEETSPADGTLTEAVIQCEDGRVTVTRTGTLLTTLVFDEHETFIGDYPTPVGSLQLRAYASEVSIKRRGLVGHVRVVYQISLSTTYSPSEEMTLRTLDIKFVPCRN